MNTKYSGSEKGLKLTPKGVNYYSELLCKTSLVFSNQDTPDPDRTVFSISERQEVLDGSLSINILIDEDIIGQLFRQDLMFAVLIKETSSRSSRVACNIPLLEAVARGRIDLEDSLFRGLAFSTSIFIDVLVYEITRSQGHLIQSLKRFSLSFSAVAGLWSIEAVEPQFFISRGGGKDTLFMTVMEFEGEEDMTMRPAIEIVKVYLNKGCVREFERLTNKADTSGDVIRRLFVHNIVLKIAHQLFTTCTSYPRKADHGSVADKVLEILDISNEADYYSLQEAASRDNESLSWRIQNRLGLSTAASKYTGGK